MANTTFSGHFLGPDTHANRPSATGLPEGVMYVCTTHSKIERIVSGAWADYATLAGAGMATDTLWDTKGDLAVASAADTAAKLAVGSNNQVLTADSAQTLGVKWAAAAAGGATVVDYTEGTGTVTVSATTSGTANTIVTASAHTFDGTTLHCVEFYTPNASPPASAGTALFLALFDGSTLVLTLAEVVPASATASSVVPVCVRRYLTPTAASHTYSIRGWVASGSGSVLGGGGGPTRAPFYIRITSGA